MSFICKKLPLSLKFPFRRKVKYPLFAPSTELYQEIDLFNNAHWDFPTPRLQRLFRNGDTSFSPRSNIVSFSFRAINNPCTRELQVSALITPVVTLLQFPSSAFSMEISSNLRPRRTTGILFYPACNVVLVPLVSLFVFRRGSVKMVEQAARRSYLPRERA